ncbi:hypothetical protein OF83DRAFT_1149347 [Amylostereum chailletii]|nr:hypothetical protein OF83DRAFT_1149347 [Amylostereum chailletii]
MFPGFAIKMDDELLFAALKYPTTLFNLAIPYLMLSASCSRAAFSCLPCDLYLRRGDVCRVVVATSRPFSCGLGYLFL